MPERPTPNDRHRAAVLAGYQDDPDAARALLIDPDARVRKSALGALARLGQLDDAVFAAAMADEDSAVRCRAITLAIAHREIEVVKMLDDPDPTVVEHAAWACGERVPADDDAVERLIPLAVDHDDSLVREAAVAALGAIGDPAGLDAVLAGCRDKATIRRRAVLALAPFDSPDVRSALLAARQDRDWQVRQSAEDLVSIMNLDDADVEADTDSPTSPTGPSSAT